MKNENLNSFSRFHFYAIFLLFIFVNNALWSWNSSVFEKQVLYEIVGDLPVDMDEENENMGDVEEDNPLDNFDFSNMIKGIYLEPFLPGTKLYLSSTMFIITPPPEFQLS